jgi:choline dehydrogenase
LLSGVGPAHDLQQLKIPIVKDLPGVGSHLVDHPVVDVYFKDKLNNSSKHIKPKTLPEVFKVIGSAVQYFITRRGALATNVGFFLITLQFKKSVDTILVWGGSGFY